MNNFNKGNKRGGERGDRRNDSRGGDFRREKPKMHQVICGKCGVKCQVPFKPTGDKPVFCSECFESHSGGGDNRKSFTKKQFTPQRENNNYCQDIKHEQIKYYNSFEIQMNKVTEKLDKIITLLKESKSELALKGAVKTAKEEAQKEKPEKIEKEKKSKEKVKKEKKKTVKKAVAKKTKEKKSTKK